MLTRKGILFTFAAVYFSFLAYYNIIIEEESPLIYKVIAFHPVFLWVFALLSYGIQVLFKEFCYN